MKGQQLSTRISIAALIAVVAAATGHWLLTILATLVIAVMVFGSLVGTSR